MLWGCSTAACSTPDKSQAKTILVPPPPRPRFIHGALPVAPFVAEQLALAPGAQTIVYAVPEPDGRASDRRIEGSINGEGAVSNILSRLPAVLATARTP